MTIVNPLPYTIQNGQAVDAVPVMANFNQIVSNVNANAAPANVLSTATTPPQFDNSTALATTAFVKRSGLLFNSWAVYYGTGNISIADAGKAIQLAPSASAATLTLPAANAAPNGTALFLKNTSSYSVTIQRSGSDSIVLGTTTLTSTVVQPGDDLLLVTNGGSTWFCVSGSAQLSGSSRFSVVFNGNGYKMGPAGEIDQWAYAATGTSNAGNMMVTLPVAFSSGFLSATVCSANYSNPPTAVGIGGGSTLTQIQVYFAANTSGVYLRVIGK